MRGGSTGVSVHSYSSVTPSVHSPMLMLLGSSLKRGGIFTDHIWNDARFRLYMASTFDFGR